MEDAWDIWCEAQSLQQEGEMDCGLCVFGKLVNLTREEVLADVPNAADGISVNAWEEYLRSRLKPLGLAPHRYQPGEDHPLPCAHLVVSGTPHWVYEATNHGIHNPSPSFRYMPPRRLRLEDCGDHILTITIEPLPREPGMPSD